MNVPNFVSLAPMLLSGNATPKQRIGKTGTRGIPLLPGGADGVDLRVALPCPLRTPCVKGSHPRSSPEAAQNMIRITDLQGLCDMGHIQTPPPLVILDKDVRCTPSTLNFQKVLSAFAARGTSSRYSVWQPVSIA